MYQTLLTEIENHIFTIHINRPEKLNALNRSVMDDLQAAVKEIYTNPEIRSAIITGTGPKSFVAGADVNEFLGLSKKQGMELAKKGLDIFFSIENASKPIVAAVNGFALGGGCELAMACHFRLCSEHAKFGQPEVNLGLIPGYGGTQRLTRLVGRAKALELMMSAALIDAQEALRLGLVNHVTTAEDLLPKTREILKTIGGKAPIAISHLIDCVNAAENGQNGFEKELNAFGECFGTQDMKEGTAAFLEKRKTNFSGK